MFLYVIDEQQIVSAFDHGRELLLSGELPNLKQLIELYVERVDIYPDSVSVTLNVLRGLKAQENAPQQDKLNRVFFRCSCTYRDSKQERHNDKK